MFRRLLDLFSTVWLGIGLAVVLFAYCSIGSAMPAVRQLPWIEKTEFEWFQWWPFGLLILLICTNIIVTTIRRIPLRAVNAGVWTIHTGIILLATGSYYYFGTKVEGDTPVFRRQVRIDMPNMDHAVTLPAMPGSRTQVIAGPDLWRFNIQSTNSAWPILSDEHKGETAYAVNVMVTPPTGDAFVRQLLAGYPQYTEDVIPGRGRAIKSIGRKLVNEDLKLSLEYDEQKYFQVMDTWALFVRRVGDAEWVERPIEWLPRYHDRIGSRDQVFSDPHQAVPLRSIDLPVDPRPEGDALGPAPVRITGYLRYARFQRRWRDGGAQLNPVLRASILSDQAAPQTHDLVALDRAGHTSGDGMIEFRWLRDETEVAGLQRDARALLHVSVPSAGVERDVPITSARVVGHSGPFTKIEGTDFSYRILNLQDDLVIPGSGNMVSVAMVEIQTPDGAFTRMVADRPGMTRDMVGGEADPHGHGARAPAEADPRIVMTYQPRSAPVVFAGFPGGLHLVVNGPSGRLLDRRVSVGEAVEVVPGLHVRADALWLHAISEVKPMIVPPSQRRKDAGLSFAMIRLEVNNGHDVQAKWLRFHQYALPNEQYAYEGRFAYAPQRFRLADGAEVEVLFSRQRRALPSPIALETFTLDTHLGGFTGQALTIRNFVSTLRFRGADGWTDPISIKVNAPTDHGGYWYFQSTWDKPPTNRPGGGMNYTGLGVGNRNGVHVQLAGCCFAVAGMIFAFYVKPILIRRRHRASRAKLDTPAPDAKNRSDARRQTEAVGV